MNYLCIILFLFVCGISDLRKRTVNTSLCLMVSLVGIIVHIVKNESIGMNWGMGVVLGILFLGIAIMTREKIGLGDGLVILAMGTCLGGLESFRIVVWAFLFCTAWALLGISIFKMSARSRIPFVPFLAIASVVQWVFQ